MNPSDAEPRSPSLAAASTAPGSARAGSPHSNPPPLDGDVARLQDRLRVSNEWNVRLQNQIEELLRLPHNDVEALRERMQSPEIAIPLLQCYDAAILEKADENEVLRKENAQLKAAAEGRTAETAEMSHAVRVAEDLARHVQAKCTEEAQRAQQSLRELQAECAQLRQELSRALESEGEAKRASERLTRQLAEQTARAAALEGEQRRLEEALRLSTDRCRRLESGEGEALVEREAQAVRAAVLAREKADNLEELERLRAKMIQGLRQAADNHAAHMKVVEERHAMTVEQLRSALRTQELEVQRLRAHVARAEVAGRSGPTGTAGSPLLTSTTELLEAQARQAQEAELNRVYRELTQAQTERDDAVLRYEKLTLTLRREREQQQLTLQSETASLAAMRDEAVQRAERAAAELNASRQDVTRLQDSLRTAQQALSEARVERDSLRDQLRELTAREAMVSARLTECEEQRHADEAAALERRASMERRVEATLAEVQEARTRAFATVERVTAEREEARRSAEGLREQLAASQRAASEWERERLAAQTLASRLTEALEMHKRQLTACDEKLVAVQAQLEATRQQNRSTVLALERLKLENARLARAHEYLLEHGGGGGGARGGSAVF